MNDLSFCSLALQTNDCHFQELLLFFAFAKIGFFEWLLLTLIAAFSIIVSYVRYSRRLDGRYDLRVLLGISKDGKSVKMPQDYADFAGSERCSIR